MHEKFDPLPSWTLHMQARNLSQNTISERTRVITQFGIDTGVEPHQATTDDIAAWLAAGPWSASSRATYHGYLKAWFQWLQIQEIREDNPMVKIPTPRVPRRRPRPVDDRHLVRLLRLKLHRRTRAMILLAALQGLRVHEIAKVRGQDFDLLSGTMRVEGKGGSVHHLPLHPLVVELTESMPPTGYWFPTTKAARNPNGHVRSKSVSDVIGVAMRRAGVPGTPHSLRHWFGTTLVDSGVDLRTTQELLRHASLATTQIYTQVSDRQRIAGIRRLDPWRAETSSMPGPDQPAA
ncbi:tyrosine-type recombinase/integrase [Rhodococcus pyridinivorans]|uniref:Tyrosine-type recombinase/integrase n=1 Tax=Rhodococcus pyridinivorans TaxID=103816 RepID=A0A7M2XRD6_9NOCA|nr:tyrosine-type recombinase/integrase [Rhodococcus pyridinivorans]QOV99490.1 tyrosine-type recombinase/integrase [Rhodococcus pyridinivorans]